MSVHRIVHWTSCIRADVCNKHMCVVHNAIAAVAAAMPSIQNRCRAFVFRAFCYCFPFSFSHYAVQLLLLLFGAFVFSRFCVPFEYEMWTKMVVNTDTVARTHAHVSALCQRIRIGCDFGAMPTHFDCCNAHMYGFTWTLIGITPPQLLFGRSLRNSKDKMLQ